ncbi:hypothetical protein ACVXG8_23205 [Escherichia coli]
MGILILAMFVMVMMSMVVVIFVIVVMMFMIILVHILQPVALAAPGTQNIQNAVPMISLRKSAGATVLLIEHGAC